MVISILLGFLPLGVWLHLLLGRERFWLLRERDNHTAPRPARWPAVVAVVPARNEADVIERSVESLLRQAYPGPFRVIVVDDQSEDGTGDLARRLASDRLSVIAAGPRPPGWTGKLWALHQGVSQVLAEPQGAPDYLWFTDADIAHSPDNLAELAARAESGGRVLVSLMARLSCATPAERLLIPAFVFFFAMLYPFGAVNRRGRRTAAAAGGCMLVRSDALIRAGGIAALRGALIDDCALARLLKAQGPIWLGLTDRAVSLRPYERLSDLRAMVSRSAYAQLRYSPLLLVLTLLALLLIFDAPVISACFGRGPVQAAGWFAWMLMVLLFQPILRFYGRSWAWGLALPAIAFVYASFTFDSALRHWSGKGGWWKGRAQADGG